MLNANLDGWLDKLMSAWFFVGHSLKSGNILPLSKCLSTFFTLTVEHFMSLNSHV